MRTGSFSGPSELIPQGSRSNLAFSSQPLGLADNCRICRNWPSSEIERDEASKRSARFEIGALMLWTVAPSPSSITHPILPDALKGGYARPPFLLLILILLPLFALRVHPWLETWTFSLVRSQFTCNVLTA